MTQETPAKTLLIVEDDKAFRNRLALSMERKGFTVYAAEGIEEGSILAAEHRPQYAVVDMRLEDGNGLDLVPQLRQIRPDIRVVILTGYGNIASAVAAVKAGAVDYLAKPADPDQIEKTLLTLEGHMPPPPENPMSADRVKWEHIQRVYELCDRNVSETARRLNMHRRTLQRILAKRSPQ
ncbi:MULTISPECIES: ActR/PrrA/RegA family redox response regulator transcription factor [Kordiimonas]|uniref:ActR/PrrA/RegA family redox response regulator transcription factor n=1 Tax=Kordiimonas TaxID=288021 RepID=UPI001FF14373|nr:MULTISPECIES: ActR/PrrA/RegA family redox response regulator transcription factor [Kordiimonas]MCK0069331.1 ActR/PrrA/RegA family redox response regulator transcription factor [Kordiimonas laminariae]UTW58660.1 ActR/PrrA/RegA family redox response regulator transcription factor [Kordiimonas sp. SCSIO 12603]